MNNHKQSSLKFLTNYFLGLKIFFNKNSRPSTINVIVFNQLPFLAVLNDASCYYQDIKTFNKLQKLKFKQILLTVYYKKHVCTHSTHRHM